MGGFQLVHRASSLALHKITDTRMGRVSLLVWIALFLSPCFGLPTTTNTSDVVGGESGFGLSLADQGDETLDESLVKPLARSTSDVVHRDLLDFMAQALRDSSTNCSVVSSERKDLANLRAEVAATHKRETDVVVSIFSLVGHIRTNMPRTADADIECASRADLVLLQRTSLRSNTAAWMRTHGLLEVQLDDTGTTSLSDLGDNNHSRRPPLTTVLIVGAIVAVVLGVLGSAVRAIVAEQARLKFWTNVETALLQGGKTSSYALEIPNKLVEVELTALAEQKQMPRRQAPSYMSDDENFPLVHPHGGPTAVLEINSQSACCEVRKVTDVHTE